MLREYTVVPKKLCEWVTPPILTEPRLIDYATAFTQSVYANIESELVDRSKNLEVLLGKKGKPIRLDPFSCQSCCRMISSVDTDTLSQWGITRSAGYVETYEPNGRLLLRRGHAYFSCVFNPEIVIDYTIGQFALNRNESLDEWINLAPHLFPVGRAIVAYKSDIVSTLGVQYPAVNETFESFFLDGLNQSVLQ